MSTHNPPARIIFFGNERLATGVTTSVPTLRALIAAGYNVVAVVSHDSGTRSRKTRELEIAEVAAEHDIPLLLPAKPAEIIDQLREYKADIGVLVAYGKIVPQSIIDIFPHGIVNIHPSLLPLHRGPIPIESVILDGSKETGVSVMALAREMDAGPIYGQTQVSLDGSESKQALATMLLETGGALLLELLSQILGGSLTPTAQDNYSATYDALITKADSVLDFSKPAGQLAREVRAYLGWPGSRATVGGHDLVITAARVLEAEGETTDSETPSYKPGAIWRSGKQFGIVTSDGILVIDRLKPVGKNEMDASAFLAGYKL